MKQHALEELIQRYVEAHQARIAQPIEGQRTVWASAPIATEYQAVLSAVRQQAPSPTYSDDLVQNYTDDLLNLALCDPTAIPREGAALVQLLQRPALTELYVPLDGIMISDADMQIGSVRLVRMDEETFERLLIEPFTCIMQRNSHYDAASSSRFVEEHRRRVSVMRGRTCLEISTDLDINQTFSAAEEIVAGVCDFLQVCLASLVSLRTRNPVRWSNQVAQSAEIAFGVMREPDQRTRSQAVVVGGPPAQIGTQALDTLEANGLSRLGANLGAPPANEFADILRRAVRWFAKGERELYADDARLAYVTAVDLFFSSEQQGSSTHRFCKGFAFALSEDPQQIVHLARFARHVYAGRSRTSHAGAFGFARTEGQDEFRRRALQFLAQMAEFPFETKADIEAWRTERENALTDEQRALLADAIKTKPFLQDIALIEAINTLLQAAGSPWASENEHLRHVFARVMVDAAASRDHLLQLRPYAEALRNGGCIGDGSR